MMKKSKVLEIQKALEECPFLERVNGPRLNLKLFRGLGIKIGLSNRGYLAFVVHRWNPPRDSWEKVSFEGFLDYMPPEQKEYFLFHLDLFT